MKICSLKMEEMVLHMVLADKLIYAAHFGDGQPFTPPVNARFA